MRRRPKSAGVRRDWLAAGAWAVFVALLLLAPGGALPRSPWWIPASLGGWLDSLVHAFLFFGQAWLLLRALGRSAAGTELRVTAIALTYALLLEVLQIPVPRRNFELVDIVFAGVGIAAALALGRRGGRA